MTNTPLVSIIIPTYNRAHLIGETLDSVLAQTYTNWECIVVDDGSTDGTDKVLAAYCEKDARFKYINRPDSHQPGGNGARNYGFELSKGKYVLFLDSDDIITNYCLTRRLAQFNDSKIDFVIANTSKFQDTLFDEKAINIDPCLKTNENYILLFMNYKLPWTIMSVLWKRSVIQEFSFDESLLRFQDVDLHIRVLMSKKYVFKRLDETDNYYRHSGFEKTNKEYDNKVVKGFFKLIDKFGHIESLDISYINAFKRFCYIISRDFIYFSKSKNKIDKKEFYFLMNKYNFLNFKDLSIFTMIRFYSFYSLESKKGFGYNRFRRFCNKYYDKSLTFY